METIDELTVYNNAVKALVEHINAFRTIHHTYEVNKQIDILDKVLIRQLSLSESEMSKFCFDRIADYV
jgi:uncharacterized membrane protein affecting hemolysin expression